jgi:hypothetical protein
VRTLTTLRLVQVWIAYCYENRHLNSVAVVSFLTASASVSGVNFDAGPALAVSALASALTLLYSRGSRFLKFNKRHVDLDRKKNFFDGFSFGSGCKFRCGSGFGGFSSGFSSYPTVQ